VFKITGGQDKQGFPMKQVLVLHSDACPLPARHSCCNLHTATTQIQPRKFVGSRLQRVPFRRHSIAAAAGGHGPSYVRLDNDMLWASALPEAEHALVQAVRHVLLLRCVALALTMVLVRCTGRAGAGPRVAADEAGRHVLPRVRAPQGRAPPQVRARLHRQPGPQRAQPDHRQARCAQHVRGYPSMITGDPRVLSSSVCGRHLACGPQHAHTWPGFHCTTAV